MKLIELHDHPRFPAPLRDLVTDALEALWEFGNSYKPILPMLRAGIVPGGDDGSVVDLCSGGGGPWLSLAWQLESRGFRVRVRLTDKYPNADAFERARSRSMGLVEAVMEPVDARHVPRELGGFRTMFSSFHHFGPKDARAVLRDAVASGQGIGIFEVPSRELRTLLMVCLTPALVVALTPVMRPFRWARLFWTYVVPVVPFVIWYDGVVSCFRAYSEVELREMVEEMPEYRWETGEARTGMLAVTYVVGVPVGESGGRYV